MKTIKVLGSGCAKCQSTVHLIEGTAEARHIEVNIEKVEDMAQIAAYGVMSTPAVVVGETVVHKGSIPSHEQVVHWLETA